MDLYLKGTGIISAAGNNRTEGFPNAVRNEETDKILAIEPDYTGEIPPMQLRRMGKAVRMGIAAAKECMKQSGIERPDAISVGTAMGCLEDTDNFLRKMVSQGEQMLTPTAFIQSTHNTVAGTIAMLTGCNGHNLTYVQRGHSFEHAMINAQLYLGEHPGEKMLVGGIDELTDTSQAVLQHAKVYRVENSNPSELLASAETGSIAGEGVAFFTVTDTRPQGLNLHVKDISAFVTKDITVALNKVNEFISRNSIKLEDIDLVMLGISGDERTSLFYKKLQQSTFAKNSQAAFKHLSGEYGTASALGLGMIMHAADQNHLPESMVLNHAPKKLENILLINNYVHYYSFWHISVLR
ncbi:beta-ketoacyl synthase N-terminal-like domain-containing protein [Polluticoccus soli]|uniref:beta-ketoacyl synthase N-terminal-like domain-containing protein n=1 Tax=Polluticoccus soli TaxID=3034150 RepID=UPI0023E10F50|nr:beta-ketoacyl synthase chain length factor [Flavipsychrobacter sp. JY13-12]